MSLSFKTMKLAWPAAVACLAVIFIYYPSDDADSSNQEALSLMQTTLQVSGRSLANQTLTQSRSIANQTLTQSLAADPDELSVPQIVERAGLGPKEWLEALEPCTTDFNPMHIQSQNEMLRLVGAMPPRKPCKPVALLSTSSSSSSSSESGFPMLLNVHVPKSRTIIAIAVPIIYLLVLGFIISRMISTVLLARPKVVATRASSVVRRPEQEAWKSGLISWLSISWATEWVTKWGNSTSASAISIKSDELDGMGDPEDEPAVGYKKLLVVWDEELKRKGLKEASVIRVMLKFVSMRRLIGLILWTVGYEVALYLGPPLAMQWSIQYVCMLFTLRVQGWQIPHAALGLPSLVIILTFTGLPVMMGVCNTVSSFLSQRMAMQTCGALSSLVVRKAQCLSSASEVSKAEKQKARLKDTERAANEDSDDEILRAKPEEGEITDVVTDENNQWQGPETFSLVQVVANDINMSFIQLPLQICRTIIILPVCVALFLLLWARVKATILLVLGTAIVFTFLTAKTAGFQITYLMGFLNYVGVRLQYMENVLFSIRTVKACGWEAIVNHKVQEMRKMELVALEGYYWRLGVMYTIIYSLPKALMFVAIWGYHWLYPNIPTVNIFATLPLLFTTQSAIMSVLQALPALINAKPAVMRCEAFLKQPEAPLGRPKNEVKPPWLRLWDSKTGEIKRPLQAGMEETAPLRSAMRVKGAFSWSSPGKGIHKPCLEDIDLDLPTGQSLAVIGATGCGKTTLLHAILGELYPLGDACLEVPAEISYSAQVPYICEGTLRENVLFGEPLDEEHYKTAIHSACLLPDLEMLPGGEDVPIGSRGISLSGGQKARISIARASYTSACGGLVLMDDPFGAVDSRTARHLLDHLIHGRGLEGRTRVVVTQPDPERITRFDQVAIIAKGRIVVKGTPGEVMETDMYQALLNTHQIEALKTIGEGDAMVSATETTREANGQRRAPEVFQLREEEFQGRIDGKTLNYFGSAGSWRLIIACITLYFFQQVCYLMMNITLQDWSTDQMLYSTGIGAKEPTPIKYMWGFIAWFFASNAIWALCWISGVWFTLKMSRAVFKNVFTGLMHAPTDRFFDRTPVGRIMNRLSSDLANLDNNTYNQITILIGLCWQTMVPISYIHLLMPLYFTVLTVPVYYLVFSLIRRYWNTMVPMRYLTHVSKSSTDDILTEVSHSNISVRAMQKANFRLAVFQSLLSNQMKADVTTTLVLQRWLVNRLFLLLGFFITVLVLVAVWVPHIISFGGIGLALCNCFTVVTGIEMYIGAAAQAQFQFISLNRLYEYTRLPQEKPSELASDGKFKTFAATLLRPAVGKLVQREEDGLIRVYREKADGMEELVLLQDPGTQTFRAPDDKNFGLLAPDDAPMEASAPWHRIVAVNGTRGDIYGMAVFLCNAQLDRVRIEVQSGWLTQGAEVVIEDLRTGYGDIPRDVLKDVNIIIDPCTKSGIVGTTGCGKSTLLLSMLRILEPREGRILLNGVDTQHVGLQTLRQAIGLVPQDPVLMQASVRENLDPFWLYSDDEIMRGLEMVQLADVVKAFEYGVWTPLAADGGNLSFGQRQLLCLARTVIRQPSLILLDEATSALDPATQELVQKTIESSFPKSTIIVIAHRLETILNFDQIIVMEQGSVAEKGSPSDLGEVKGGLFAKMLAAKRTW